MKIKLKSKFHDNYGLTVSIDGADVEIYQLDTTRQILHKLIDEVERSNCLERILDTAILGHPDVDIKTKAGGYKATLKINL